MSAPAGRETESERRRRVEAEFDAEDAQGAGSVDAAQLVSLVARVGGSATREQVDRAMEHLDDSGAGRAPKDAVVDWFLAHGAPEALQLPRPNDGAGLGRTASRNGGGSQARPLRASQSMSLGTKNERKRAEADRQLLANRLAHLRAAESKAQRRVEETRRRAQDVARAKQQRSKEAERREKLRQEKEAEEAALREAAAAKRRTAQQRRREAIGSTHGSKRGAASQVAREREQQRLQRERQEAEEAEAKRRQRERVRAQHDRMRRRRAEEGDAERRRQTKRVRERANEERRRIEAAEQRVAAMEEEERALIDRLREMQTRQRQAYADLEEALAEEAEEKE